MYRVIEGVLGDEREDGGAAFIGELLDDEKPEMSLEEFTNYDSQTESSGLFLRFHSYDERAWSEDPELRARTHEDVTPLIGRKVRVTIELID